MSNILIEAIRAWIAHERQEKQFQKVFGKMTLRRKEYKHINALAHQLLIWHIEQGHTLKTIEAMISQQKGAGSE